MSGGGVLGWLEPVYRRQLAQRPALLQDRRYVEVKAETIAANWPDSRHELFRRLGLPDADTVNTFAASRLAARRGELSDTGNAEVVSRLGWAAGELGYPARPRSARPVWMERAGPDEWVPGRRRGVSDKPSEPPLRQVT
jgi:hypothetical protein